MDTSKLKIAVELQTDSNAKACYSIAAITVLYYDYLLTLPIESQLFWKQRDCSLIPSLFYVNRYASLAAHVPVIAEYFWVSDAPADKVRICHKLHVYHQYYAVAAQLVIAILLISRTYALYERSRRILALLCATAASALALGCWSIASSGHSQTPVNVDLWPRVGCVESLTDREGIHLAIAWGGLLVFDLLIYFLTLRKALVTPSNIMRGSIIHTILRDASVYVAVIFMSNVSNVLTLVIAPSMLKGISTTFSNIMASVMVSRLLFNLRRSDTRYPSTVARSSLHFATGDEAESDVQETRASVSILQNV